MFCGENYAHFHEIEALCEEAAAKHLPYKSGEEAVWLDEEEGEIDFTQSRAEKRNIYEGIFYEIFLDKMRHRAVACSPSGETLRLSWFAVRPIIFNHFMSFDQRFYNHWKTLLFIDTRTGTLDPAGARERSRMVADSESADAPETYFFMHSWEAKALMPLQGWGVGFERKGMPTVDEMVRTQKKKEKPNSASVPAMRGRPRKREEAALAYSAEFPTGHDGLSRKEVLKSLREQHGIIVSWDTLQTGLRELCAPEKRGQ